MIDVDHFKAFNDEFGHAAGDDVLREVGRLIGASAREYDTATRYGGEEFTLVLPGADPDEAWAAVERLRAAIEAHCWDRRPITVSVGVATAYGGDAEVASLPELADAALYRSKRLGRNRVSSHRQAIPSREGTPE